MKRIGLALMVIVLLAGSAFAAPARLTMATGGVAGTYFPFGGVLAQVINDNTGGAIEITVQSTGATVENLNLIEMGDVDLALVQNDISYFAYRGTEFYEGKPIANLRAITRLFPELLHVVAQVDIEASSMSNFMGRRVAVGASGSGNEANCRQIFPFFGLNYENTTPFFISFAESANHFRDHLIDAFVFTTAPPNPAIMDILTARDVTFVPVEGPIRDAIIREFPYFTAETLPANTYARQTEDVETIAVQAILAVSADLSDDVVYAMTKAMFENLEAIRTGHAIGYHLSAEYALRGLTVPLHPGAERYFRSIGIIN